jgi:environmental stress-induced protein Ves
MTRRERSTHSMRRLRIAGSVEVPLQAPLALLICAEGSLQIEMNAQTAALMALDALLVVEEGAATLRISSDASVLAYLIEIH